MIELDALDVTLICCRKHTRRSRPEAGEYHALLAVKDTETGETGHKDEFEGPSVFDWGQINEDAGIEPDKHPAWLNCTIPAYGDENGASTW